MNAVELKECTEKFYLQLFIDRWKDFFFKEDRWKDMLDHTLEKYRNYYCMKL